MTKTMRTLTKRISAIALTIVMTLGSAAVVYANPSSRLDEARQRSYEQRQQARERAEANRQAAWDRLIDQTPEQHRQAVIEARDRSGANASQVQPSQPSQPQHGQVRPAAPATQNQTQTGGSGRAMPTNVTLTGTTLHIYEMTGVNILENTEPIFLTNEQLVTLAEKAPDFRETRSSFTLPERRLTDQEIDNWIREYHELGGANRQELEHLRVANIERAGEGIVPVAFDPLLMMAARYKAQERAELNHLYRGLPSAHYSPVYGTPCRIPYEIFGATLLMENLTNTLLLDGLRNSPSHRANLLKENLEGMGFGLHRETNSTINPDLHFSVMMGG